MTNLNGYQSAPNFGPSQNQFPPFTNIILVDSLEQALRMPARMHSEMVYWNRYKDEIYRVYTDYSNGKQYMVLDVSIKKVPKEETKTEDSYDMSSLIKKVEELESKLEVLNEKHNVDSDVGAATVSASTTTSTTTSTAK